MQFSTSYQCTKFGPPANVTKILRPPTPQKKDKAEVFNFDLTLNRYDRKIAKNNFLNQFIQYLLGVKAILHKNNLSRIQI